MASDGRRQAKGKKIGSLSIALFGLEADSTALNTNGKRGNQD
jgi:hypothetical protein